MRTIVKRCNFCRRGFTEAEFLAMPLCSNKTEEQCVQSFDDGTKLVYRNCDCLPDGQRGTFVIEYDAKGNIVI